MGGEMNEGVGCVRYICILFIENEEYVVANISYIGMYTPFCKSYDYEKSEYECDSCLKPVRGNKGR
jgi:hypothetical protein